MTTIADDDGWLEGLVGRFAPGASLDALWAFRQSDGVPEDPDNSAFTLKIGTTENDVLAEADGEWSEADGAWLFAFDSDDAWDALTQGDPARPRDYAAWITMVRDGAKAVRLRGRLTVRPLAATISAL